MPRFGRFSLMMSLGLLTAVLTGPVGARAQDATIVRYPEQKMSIEVPAAGLVANCTLTASGYSLTYTRPNGTKYGTHYWTSAASCDRNMVYLWTLAFITKLPATEIHRGAPGVCGTDKLAVKGVVGCTSRSMSGGSYYCDPCNGSWTLTAEYRMRFPNVVGRWSPANCILLDLSKPGRFGCKKVSGSLTL